MMRFGIMSTQMNLLVPPGLPAEGLMSHLAGFRHADLVRSIAAQGFSLIELGGDLEMLLPQLYTDKAIQELADLKAELGVKYTVHLPLWSVETSTPLTPVREGSIQAVIDHIRRVEVLEPEVFVLHATGALAAEFYRMKLPELAKGFLLRQFQNAAHESVQRILSATGLQNRKIAIETIEFPFEMTLALAQELDLSICLDTGHILAGFSGRVELFNVLEQCLPRLGEIHLHDCPIDQEKIGYGKDHQALGKGDLDIARLLNRLSEANYAKPIIFELTLEQATESLAEIQSKNPGVL
jgi:sugar phosphate isomerase/epimerase